MYHPRVCGACSEDEEQGGKLPDPSITQWSSGSSWKEHSAVRAFHPRDLRTSANATLLNSKELPRAQLSLPRSGQNVLPKISLKALDKGTAPATAHRARRRESRATRLVSKQATHTHTLFSPRSQWGPAFSKLATVVAS